MVDILGMVILIFGVFIIVLVSIAALAHHCDGCGERLVRLTGNNWRCPNCGRHYLIGKLGLGKQLEI